MLGLGATENLKKKNVRVRSLFLILFDAIVLLFPESLSSGPAPHFFFSIFSFFFLVFLVFFFEKLVCLIRDVTSP